MKTARKWQLLALALLPFAGGCGWSDRGSIAPSGTTSGGTGTEVEAGSSSGGSAGILAHGGAGGVPAITFGGVRWVGRVDLSSATGQRFAWSGTGLVATATGARISVKLRANGGSDAIYFQPVIDGLPGARLSVAAAEGEKTLTLGSGLAPGDHVVELYRETEGKAGFAYTTFLGFVDGTLKDPPPYNGRLIEIIGDSISAGYGALGAEQHPNYGPDPSGGCTFSTLTESAYASYGALAARAVGADASIVAASGWGIYSDNSGNVSNVLPVLYPNTLGGLSAPVWPFLLLPQAVIINLGTNDFSANMSLGSDTFTTAYRALLTTVRAKNPDAWIYCAIGPLLYSTGLNNATTYLTALVASVNAGGDTKVKVLNLGSQNTSLGTGCQYHPNVTEHQRMAGILTTELRTTLGW